MTSPWEQIYDRFDPELPPPRKWRADRDGSPAADILRVLDLPMGTPKVLLTGTVGTGKSTELMRVADARAETGKECVILLDLVHHFSSIVGDLEGLQHIHSWEVCFLLAAALIRAAEERFGYAFAPEQIRGLENAWTEIAQVSLPGAPLQIDVPKLAKSMAFLASEVASTVAAPNLSLGLKAISAVAEAPKWSLPLGRRDTRRLEDQEGPMKRLFQSVELVIGTFQQWNRPVLFVIDGLDRIEDFKHAETLLVRSQMLQLLPCRLIVCGPFALRHHLAANTVRGFSERCALANAPVLAHDNPSKHGPGVAFLCELYHRRVADLRGEKLLAPELLARLAYYSGGRSRDFVRLIRMLAERAYGSDTANESMVATVIDKARRLMEDGVTKGHVAALESIARDPNHELPDGELAQQLLTYGRLLPYPNESEWFYPHPLLTLRKVKTSPGSTR